ncbi:MAG: hypothetical protein IKA79_04320 [Lentisphaeria bacterium]|nr:hypothetical protein [Lentisphaeria bacterium]
MISKSVFTSNNGCREIFFAGESTPAKDFQSEALSLLEEYEKILAENSCSEASEFLLRFHLSDIANQGHFLREKLKGRCSFISVIGQAPASHARLALTAWHIPGMKKEKLSGEAFKVSWKDYTAILFRQETAFSGSYRQMMEEFVSLQDLLHKENACVEENTLRTWIYCKDVDNNYAGLVKARNDFFDTVGLTKENHFIASTGIAGECEDPSRIVKMDSLSYTGLAQEQIQHLYALDFLSSTALYGVRFERGTRITFGDRSHYYISGTASIDREGQVLFLYDVEKQTERIMENLAALLKEGGGDLPDIKLATVYLRDPADVFIVKKVMEKHFPGTLPAVFLKAPVCRPAWLVEIECIGLNGNAGEFAPLI